MKDIWDPFEEMKRFRREMDKMFDDFWAEQKKIMKRTGIQLRQPLVDVRDKKNAIEITAELPGIDKKDIIINVEPERIEIKAKKKEEIEVKKKDFYRQERSYSGFYRAFTLPAIVNPDKAKSEFKNGVLKITLPKVAQLKKKAKKLLLK
ncbi:Hsp20/alpha crystallin family protein [Candidatus Woesearchaeota archaeon]|nr:MAG: Hsp20/alpha crystallin family protein [Candidatus Woesearchaeota archaeon]